MIITDIDTSRDWTKTTTAQIDKSGTNHQFVIFCAKLITGLFDKL